MTDKEIIKALECCMKDDCDNCPNDFGNCCANLAGCSLDLITRQRAEIEMTDNVIIKCLEQAIDKYNKNEIFVDNMRLDKLSLNLINRQQAEIERLKTHINEVADKVEDKMTYMSGCQNLIQTVKKIILGDKTPSESLCDNCGLCKEREEEAVKEFAKRLKEKSYTFYKIIDCHSVRRKAVDIVYIDNLLKEMAGETE